MALELSNQIYVGGVQMIAKADTIRTLLSMPPPRPRLTVEWGDGPTEVDTTEPLVPQALTISEEFLLTNTALAHLDLEGKDLEGKNLEGKDFVEIDYMGMKVKVRILRWRTERLTKDISLLKLEGVEDAPRYKYSEESEGTPLEQVCTLLDGTDEPRDIHRVKPGAVVEAPKGGNTYHTWKSGAVEDRTEFTVRGLIRGGWMAEHTVLGSLHERLWRVLFAKSTRVQGVQAEYQSFTTTDLLERGGRYYWEFNITFKTL